MNKSLIFLPVLVQVLLTIIIFVWLGVVKSKAVKLGQVNQEKRALHHDAWPDYVLKVSNNISNQFETPVLFYILAMILWAQDSVDVFALFSAWGFAASRILHAYIHLGSNYVPMRRRAFTVGCLFLFLMTILCFKAILVSQMAQQISN